MSIAVSLAIGALLLAWFVEYRRRDPHPVADGLQPDIELPHDQAFELYHNALSVCSMKVRVCLAELQIPYKSHHIDLIETGAFETTRVSFRRVNPAGTVPVLVHNGHPVYQSHEQIRYAANHASPEASSLVPDDPDEFALMNEWVDRSSLTAQPLDNMATSAGNAVPGQTFPLFATMIEKIPFWRIIEGLLFHHNKRLPMLFVLLKLKGLKVLGTDPMLSNVFSESRSHMHDHLDALEQRLATSNGPWIVGQQYTLADVSWLVIFERLQQVAVIDSFVTVEDRPLCAAYWRRLQERPAYRTAILDHRHPVVTYGTRRLREAKAADPGLRELLDGKQHA